MLSPSDVFVYVLLLNEAYRLGHYSTAPSRWLVSVISEDEWLEKVVMGYQEPM